MIEEVPAIRPKTRCHAPLVYTYQWLNYRLFRKQEYDKYFSDLGITNTTIYPQRLVDTSPEAEYLEHVVAVFACPPNSYSGVKDPVDLGSILCNYYYLFLID